MEKDSWVMLWFKHPVKSVQLMRRYRRSKDDMSEYVSPVTWLHRELELAAEKR